MATQANAYDGWERRREAEAPSASPVRGNRPDPYRLRPLPNEEIYFYRKRIDNSGVVRQADPATRRRCLHAIFLAVTVGAGVGAFFYPSLYATESGYEIEALKQQQQHLLAEKASLEVAEARLSDPGRLQGLAPNLEFQDPSPDQVVYLNPGAGDTSLAWNAASSK